ncbi:hypothetical protein [Clostridium sp.]|uniref:hypothetical protein n=1 Tax=Clostridium sp. TaxID=1506 RepID=UPI002621FBD8|nr:hypothetical protein [Clostridium sp.]
MRYKEISFKVNRDKIREDLLNVKLDIYGEDVLSNLKLYKGKVNLEEIKSQEEIFSDANFIYIEGKSDKISFWYSLKIGGLGKHGRLGELNSDLIIFMGEQFLMLPVELLALGDSKDSKCKITIDFTGFKESFHEELRKLGISNEHISKNKISDLKELRFLSKISYSSLERCNTYKNLEKDNSNNLKSKIRFYNIIPFKEEDFKINLLNPIWSDLYELMKSPYTFGFFNLRKSKGDFGLKLYRENRIINNTCNENEIFENISKLYDYYKGLFKCEEEKALTIIFLGKSKKDNKNILGGSGKNIICASFNKDNKRDWQLLSHRMFHAFMDSKLSSRTYHLPPNLWLTEGLATYYELLALESLSEDLKEKLKIDFNREISKLYTRYIYMTLKEPNRFKIIPMEEISIKSHGKLEFLHYTKAPLIIYFLESLTKDSLGKDSILNYLVLNKDKEFSMQNMFIWLLKEKCNEFARNYLFGNSILPLWNLKEYVCEEEVLKDLNEYEYILWTWFYKEEENYVKDDLEKYPLEELKIHEDILNRVIYNRELSKNVEDYSNTLSILLKIWLFKINSSNFHWVQNDIRSRVLT